MKHTVENNNYGKYYKLHFPVKQPLSFCLPLGKSWDESSMTQYTKRLNTHMQTWRDILSENNSTK
jgi:hypothetical protein